MGKLDQIDPVVQALRSLENDRLKYVEALRDSWVLEPGIRPKSAKEISVKHAIDLQRLHELKIVVNRDQGAEFLVSMGYPADRQFLKERLSMIHYKSVLGRKGREITRLKSEVLFSYGEVGFMLDIPPLPIPRSLAEMLAETIG